MGALIGMLLTLVFILVGFFGPWISFSASTGIGGFSIDWSLISTTSLGLGTDFVSITLYIAILALIFAFLAFIGTLGAVFNFGKSDTMKKIGGIFGILTFILAIIAVFYFFANIPDVSTLGVSVGVAWGWYLFLIGAIIAIISSGMIKKIPAAK